MQKKIVLVRGLLVALATMLTLCGPARAQGTLSLSMQTVVDQNGKPIPGALVYFYQVGTVSTRQDSFQDSGLMMPWQWPLPTDAYGRIPAFYLASGSVHVRITDPTGLQIFDVPSALVIGPSGGGGAGSAVDPTAIASTGDMKFRATSETLTGWVRMNGQTIGNAVSGATGRANADAQNLFVYLWNNYPNTICPVSSGRGASGLADFNANKTIGLPDMRATGIVGMDGMGNAALGAFTAAVPFTIGNGTTAGSTGGEITHNLTTAQLPSTTVPLAITPFTPPIVSATFSGTTQTWSTNQAGIPLNTNTSVNTSFGPNFFTGGSSSAITIGQATTTITPAGTVSVGAGAVAPTGTVSFGSSTAMNLMSNFRLGTWYMKL